MFAMKCWFPFFSRPTPTEQPNLKSSRSRESSVESKTSLNIAEDFSSLSVPAVSKDCKTYYKRVVANGSQKKSSTAVPLIILHGGPLLGHDYCIPLQDLAHDSNVSMVVFYDQLGCGKSTRVSNGNQMFSDEFVSIMIHQLKSLVDDLRLSTTGFYLLGHCFGSLLGLAYAASHPEGLKGLILANALTSLADVREANQQLLKSFPAEVADGIIHFEEFSLGQRDTTSKTLKDYLWASDEYRRVHFNRAPPPTTRYWNQSRANVMEVMDVFASIAGGRVRFIWGGPISKYDVKAELHKISAPTLVIKGEYDHISSYCQESILRRVPQVKEVVLKNASHMLTEEVPVELMRTVSAFVSGL